ncbi:MAG: dihydroorotate dehydrogenase [bacterium]
MIPNLTVKIGQLKLKNPVMVASGTFGFGEEFTSFFDLNRLGAMVVKGLTLRPKAGNPPPRIVETPAGMLNAVGLENCGLEKFVTEKMPFLRQFKTPLIVNVNGKTIDEYVKLSEELSKVAGVSALELNLSCPNVKGGGMAFGVDPHMVYLVTSMVRRTTPLPLIVKLSPNVTDIKTIAQRAEEAGADGLSLINTLLGLAIDHKTGQPQLAHITGGLSGPAVKPIALRMVWEVSEQVNIPIIGMGGITGPADALEFLAAGAVAVAVGTGSFINPQLPLEVIKGLEDYLAKEKMGDIHEIIGRFSREIIYRTLVEREALLEGHFWLSSGRHSGRYFQAALILQDPSLASIWCTKLARKFKGEKIDLVIGPALGGVIVAQEVAKSLGVRAIFTERVSGKMQLRRGFRINPQERVLVVEDVITTGGSVKEVIELVKQTKAEVVGVGALVDRSGGIELGFHPESLLQVEIETYAPDSCPLCQKDLPLVKPGSK